MMMMKKILAASAFAVIAASPAMAISSNQPPGTPGAHEHVQDANGGYTRSGHYIRPHDRVGANDSFWRVNPITGGAALAFAPVAGVFGIDTGYGSYAQAEGYGAASPTVISNGQPVGWDPDPNVQLELLRGSVRYQ
jgi:opacity protein-like surface antigen